MLKECWKIKNCGREKGGSKTKELGICTASLKSLGHSCWIIAGTLCGGKVQGTFAEKEKNCIQCEVYKLYNRTFGEKLKELRTECPQECDEYKKIALSSFKK